MRRLLLVSLLVGCSASSSLGYLPPPPMSDQTVGLGLIHDGIAAALEREYVAQTERVQPPVSLVPTDGSELALSSLAADVSIDGPVAHTELRFTFHNAEARQREGRFSVTLPPTAAITRFAMKINGEWREARIVGRMKGREVYERFLHRRVDPALLEQDLGNVFSARVFPIAPLEDKELIVAYEHQVSSVRGYTLALHGLPKIGALAVAIDNNGDKQTIAKRDAVPDDIVLDVARGTDAVQYGDAFVARIEGGLTSAGRAPLDRVLYLVDTSASRAQVMGKQAALLAAFLRAQPPGSTVAVAVFDQSTRELYRGPADQAWQAQQQILHHGALGASNLGAALERATTAGMSRVVIIGDGAATAGEYDATKLAAIIRGSAIERVDAVQVGEHVDRLTLQPLVRAGKQLGAVLDGADPGVAARQLAKAVAPAMAISVDGVTTSWPATTRDVAPGEPVFVFGVRTSSGALSVHVGGHTFEVTPRDGRSKQLRRVVAGAELAAMLEAQAPAKEIEEHALKFELVSPLTSMIVLETVADERRFLDNIPTGRTFPAVLGAAAGSQADSFGVSFSGSTSLENVYIVDGVNTTGLVLGSTRMATTTGRRSGGEGGRDVTTRVRGRPPRRCGTTRSRSATAPSTSRRSRRRTHSPTRAPSARS